MLAESVVEDGGIVFGAAFDESFSVVRHIAASSVSETLAFRKSKYVQSAINDSVRQTRQALDAGRRVAFFGTPCQIAGLKAFLGKTTNGLLSVDLLCHGVPSPLLFKKYAEWMQKRLNGSLTSFDFRDKTHGWGVWVSGKTEKGELLHHGDEDPFVLWFLKHHSIRDSCLVCPFRGGRSEADITVGDYWHVRPDWLDADISKGVSKVLLRTDAGVDAFNRIRPRLIAKEQPADRALLSGNPLPTPISRSRFLKEIRGADIDALIRRYPTRLDRLQEFARVFRAKAVGYIRSRLFG